MGHKKMDTRFRFIIYYYRSVSRHLRELLKKST